MFRLLALLLLLGFLIPPVPAHGTAIVNLGSIAYNTLIPGSIGFPGVTHFAIDNLTGPNALPSAFPVTTAATFLNAQLSLLFAGGATQTVLLGDIGPGAFTSPLLAFVDTTLISSAVLSATLSPAVLTLSGGASFLPASTQLSVPLLPAYGPYLVQDLDAALIQAPESEIPEPSTLGLCALGALALVAFQLRSRWSALRRTSH